MILIIECINLFSVLLLPQLLTLTTSLDFNIKQHRATTTKFIKLTKVDPVYKEAELKHSLSQSLESLKASKDTSDQIRLD